MATKKAKKVSKLEKAKIIVKKINSDLIDASFEAIETTVKTGEKWQKLTSKLIKKTEPLTKKQINMFVDTAETIKGQLENGTERLKDLVGFDPKMFDQAKEIVTENPLTKKAEKLTSKLKKEVTDNPLVKKAEKMTAKIKKDITETIEEITEEVKEKVEKVVDGDTKKKRKKRTTKKTAAKKVTPKKVMVKKSTEKNDLKVIKGIGPKMETILNNAGITSYETLSKMTIKAINKVLTDAGIINLKMYNTAEWKAQAKLEVKK